jgi:phosphatidylglycerophosphate synthase
MQIMTESPVHVPDPPKQELSAQAGERRRFPDLGRFWTAANVLTLSRIGLMPVIAWLVYRGGPMWLLVLLIAAAVATDYFDGKVARYTGTVSEWGKILDPTADKLAAAAVTLALVVRPIEPTLPVWFVIVVVVRDIVIAGGGLIQTRRLGFVMMALWSGKVAVNLLALTVVAVLFAMPAFVIEILVWATAATLLYSLGRYLHRFVMVARYGAAIPLDERHNVLRDQLPGRAA